MEKIGRHHIEEPRMVDKMFDPKKYVEETRNKGEIVAIIMLTYNRWKLTERSLSSIFKNSFMPYILTIVDNGSWDETRERLKNLKRQGKIHKLIFLPHNMGVARGKNFGLKANRNDAHWFVCIDNDIEILSPYWLAYLCYASTWKRLGIIGANSEGFNLGTLMSHDGVTIDKCPTLGGIYAMSRTTFQKVGYFREMSLYGIEDWEIGLRQHSRGLRNGYVKPVRCRHMREIDFKMRSGKMYEDWKRDEKARTWNDYRHIGSDRTSITDADIERYTWKEE